MRQLHVTASLSRSHGGLPVFVTDLAHQLSLQGEEVTLLAGESPPGEPVVTASGPLKTLSPPHSRRWLEEQHTAEPWELVHVHGLWVRLGWEAAHFALRHGLPLVVSPHGMLEPWALRHHAWRKKLAWWLYQGRVLRRATAFHVTCGEEARQVRQLGFRQPLLVAPPGIAPAPPEPLDHAAVAAPKPRRIALFLSRLHPKKGLPLLLDAWSRIRPPGWELVIAGPDESGHRAELERQVSRLSLTNEVSFVGLVTGPERDTLLRRADLLVLPTYSENFALVVPEALQQGIPVLSTKGTPWESLATERCGWWIEVSVEALEKALTEAATLDEAERAAMGERGKALVERDYRWEKVGPLFSRFYRWIVAGGAPPEGVSPGTGIDQTNGKKGSCDRSR